MPKAHITIVEHVYYQAEDGQPTVVSNGWTRQLTTDEQPYSRRLKVGKDWQPLDTGWLDRVSLIVLSYDKLTTTTTDVVLVLYGLRDYVVASRAEDKGPTLDSSTTLILLPGESLRLSLADTSKWFVCCPGGEARCTITAFPE